MQRLLLLGLNHTTAPLDVREKLAFDARQGRAALEAFRGRFPDAEAVLVSTCNRVELYVARATHGRPRFEDAAEFLGQFHALPVAAFKDHLYHKSERDVIEHLFAVAASLDSMVLGETQILGQIRESYDAARRAQAAGALLNPLFQRALAVGKQVMTETGLGEGRISVASVAVDYARRIFETFHDKTVLCVGAGKMATLAIQNFVALRPRQLLVCNRDPERAAALAGKFGGEAVPFARLHEHLVAADIVVSSTGSAQPVITRGLFDGVLRQRRYRPIFLIDIAVPRDVEPAVGRIEHVYLYNLDDLQQVVAGTRSARQDAVESARRIVVRHVDEFTVWNRQREMGPVIDRLYRNSHRMAQEELARTVNKLGEGVSAADKAQLEELVRRVVNKLLHNPIQTLRRSEGAHAAPGVPYLHAVEKLFQLEAADSAAAAAAEDRGPDDAPATPDA